MEINQTMRNIIEIGFGLIYLIGAIFNIVYTQRHGDEFYGSFAKGAWLPPSRWLIRNVVIPHSRIFTLLLIGFQILVAVSILTRGPYVRVGLLAGAVFCFGVVFVSNIAGAVANLILASVQFLLAYTA